MAAAAFMITLMVRTVVNRPALTIDADGLIVRRLRGQVSIPWNELAPGGPPPPPRRNRASLVVYRQQRDAPPRRYSLPARDLHIDTAFLAYTIRSYIADIGRRAGIGTAAELAALRSRYGTAEAAEDPTRRPPDHE